MQDTEFSVRFEHVFNLLLNAAEKSRSFGLLALEEEIETMEFKKGRDPLRVGLQLVIDGTDSEIILQILTRIMEADVSKENYYLRILYQTIIDGVLGIQQGLNPRLLKLQLKANCPEILLPKSK